MDLVDKRHRRSIRLKGYDYSRVGAYFVTICANKRLCLFGKIIDGEMQFCDAGRMIGDAWTELSSRFPNVEIDEFVIMPNHMHGIIILNEHDGLEFRAGTRPARTEENDVRAPLVGAPPLVGAQISRAGTRPARTEENDVRAPLVGALPLVGAEISRAGTRPARTEENDVRAPLVGAPPLVGAQISRAGTRPARTEENDVRAPLVGAQISRAGTRPARTAPALGDVVGAFKSITTDRYIAGVKRLGWPAFPGKLWHRNYYEHIVRDDESLNQIRKYIADNPAAWDQDRENLDAVCCNADEPWQV